MGILDIPNELLLLVGENLSILDLYNFLSTCHRLSILLTPHLQNRVVQDKGATAVLQWAVERGNVPIAKLAISLSAKINKLYEVEYDHERATLGYLRRTPLHSAAFYGNSDLINILFKHGARINTQDPDDETPLHLAALHGGPEATRALLKLGADMTYRNNQKEMPAHLAARGSVGCMEAFIDAGFDLNTQGPYRGTVLHIAVHHTSLEMVEYLLGKKEVKMAINAPDCVGYTPLHLAVLNSKIVKLLLHHGANMEVQDQYGRTPAHRAVCSGIQGLDPESLRTFIDAGFNPSTKTKYGQTVLHYAAEFCNEKKVMEYLLKQPGVTINAQDANGMTPLSWAANRRLGPEREWMISLLERCGADRGIKDIWGVTTDLKIRRAVTHIQNQNDHDRGWYSHWDGKCYRYWDDYQW